MMSKNVGIVVIGRNEGARLKKCFDSIANTCLNQNVVYVDSGSIDRSVELANYYHFLTVELDSSQPFTAALARNRGFSAITDRVPDLDYVQFIDGDCILDRDWIVTSSIYLKTQPKVAIVCGRRRELSPHSSIYNALIDIEWDTPIGITSSCGGDFMCRVLAFNSVDGFNSKLIAGEEPELCYRLKENNWLVSRIDVEMTRHDADIQSILQWGKRAERSGYAYANGYYIHGDKEDSYNKKELLSIAFWAFLLPVMLLIFVCHTHPYALSAFFVYPLKILQIRSRYSHKYGKKVASIYAISIMFAKFFQLKGILSFYRKRILRERQTLIEYK